MSVDERLVRERRGRWIGLLYLLFLVGPFVDLFDPHTTSFRVGGAIGLIVFVAAYVRLFCLRTLFRPDGDRMIEARVLVAIMVVLMVALPLTLGDTFVGLIIYTSVACALVLPARYAFAGIIALAAVNLAVMLDLHSNDAAVLSLLLVSVLSPVMVLAMRRLVLTTRELAAAREDTARLAVAEERLRFARDLHDLLGHSLSLIVLKGELAGRLIDRDHDRAAAEVHDIESVARQALVEVREAVSGYRRSLDDELAGARTALEAAGIAVSLPDRGAPLPAPVESLLGWAVREGATNVLRHSRATRVRIRLDREDEQVRMSIEDDGAGATGDGEAAGNGLRGLGERMAAAGGIVVSGAAPDGGFRLSVTVPLDAPSYASAPRPPEVRDPSRITD